MLSLFRFLFGVLPRWRNWCGAILALPLPAGAAGPPAGTQLRVEPSFGSARLVLEHPYPTPTNGPVTIITCRFYLSGLRLTYADGSTYTEPNSYHLIDAEDSTTFTLLLAQAPTKRVKTLTFCVGVDSAANAAGAQGGDLEPGRGMYWAWHSGYVNAKLEGRSPVCRNPRKEFEFHIGGFQKPYASLRRVTLAVPANASGPLRVQADIGQWLGQLKLAETASVLVPGAAALAVADAYATMFRLAPPAARP